MRCRLVAALLAASVLPSLLGATQLVIPDHPRDLQFPQTRIELPTAESRRHLLASGPVVYLAADHTLPLVEISLALRVGGFLESPERAGLAFLTAAQIRRGGTADLDADEFDDRLDSLGVRIDTMSGSTRSGASLSAPTWSLDEGLDLFLAMLQQPRFQPDRLDVARGNLLESLSRRNENALEILEREWDWLMYGENHFSTRPVTADSLKGIERSDLVRFHRQHWRPDQMILAVSGDFDPQSLLSNLEERFAQWDQDEPRLTEVTWPPPSPSNGAGPGLYHYEMDVPQTKVLLGHRLPALLDWSSSDRFALAVVEEILGGQGAISRIAGRLRTAEGLVYRASAELYPGELWPADLEIFFETRGGSVERAVSLALEEIERLRSDPVHPLELAVVKQSLLARLRLGLDTAEEVAGYFAEDELLGRPHTYWQQYLDGVAKVTVADVQQAARDYLKPSSLLLLVVGRWHEIAPGSTEALSPLESRVGHPRTSLRTRDPMSLEILP